MMPNYQSNSINTIITMSTPHARAPVSFDADIVSTYAKINDYWREAYSQKWANDNPLWHVTLISIAGGGLDTIVPSDYASLSSLVPETHGFTVFTSSVPNVWTGSDHLSILWCDQFRKVIIRSILDAVDVRRPGQTKSRAERMRIFKKWYLTGMESIAEKELPEKGPTTLLTLEDNSNSILAAGKTLVIRELGHHGKPKAYLLPVPPISPQAIAGEKRFTLLTDQRLDATSGTGNLDVLFCSVFPLHPGQSSTLFAMNMDLSGATSGSTRLACKNAASDTILLPASKSTSKYPFDDSEPFSYLQYNLEDIIDHQFVAVIDKSASLTKGWVMAEFSDNAHFQIQPQVGLGQLLASGLSVTLPASRPMNIEVRVPAVHSSMLVYKLSLGPQGCGDNAGLFTPLVRQYISEPFESKYFVNVKEADINLHGVAPYMPPALKADSMMDGLNLQLWSDMTCSSSIDLSLKVDIGGSLGKLYMRYRTVFPAIPLVIIALVLRKQFMIHDHTSDSIPINTVCTVVLTRSRHLHNLRRGLGYVSPIIVACAALGNDHILDHTRQFQHSPLWWSLELGWKCDRDSSKIHQERPTVGFPGSFLLVPDSAFWIDRRWRLRTSQLCSPARHPYPIRFLLHCHFGTRVDKSSG